MSGQQPCCTVPELFIDGVAGIGHHMDMIRMDLFTVAMKPDPTTGEQKIQPEVRQRLIMTLPSFLATLNILEDMRRKLVESGAVAVRNGNEPAGAADTPPPVASSPNFR